MYKRQGGAQPAAGVTGQLTFQIGANKGDEVSFKIESFSFDSIFSRADKAAAGQGANGPFKDLVKTGKLQMETRSEAAAVISLMDAMISQVDSQRADLGALQNRLESSIRNQANVAANQADARSRIRDADFAEESAALSQQSIIQQAATSMLMQANSRPQLALSMLG